jgi:hypothetical protein
VRELVAHERVDESTVYPRLAQSLGDRHGLGAMSQRRSNGDRARCFMASVEDAVSHARKTMAPGTIRPKPRCGVLRSASVPQVQIRGTKSELKY